MNVGPSERMWGGPFAAGLFALAVGAACSTSTGTGGEGGRGGEAQGTGGDTSAPSTSTSSGVTPLSEHERFLLGTWRGTINANDQEYGYFVLEDDRTGCLWDRHGENFGQRYFEVQFDDWHLEESPLDEDGRMTIRLRVSSGEIHTLDRYDPENDVLYRDGGLSSRWLDLIVPCSGAGSNATETDVDRQGSAP